MIFKLSTKFLYSFILASVLFTLFLLGIKIFLVILDAVWLLLLISYGKSQNRELLGNAISLTLGVLASYFIINYIKYGSFADLDSFIILFLIFGALEILLTIVLIAFGCKKTDENDKRSVFPARQYDLKRIREFVQSEPIVGVNASWGNGKTFVIEHLCQELESEEKYAVVWIDLLTCNLDEIELFLTSELEKILTSNHIYSRNSRQLKAMLNNNFLNQVQDFVMDSSAAMSSVFSELKRDLNKINTKILIVYEDLDRLSDRKSVQKIFAISEKVSGERVHILYQYDSNNLADLGLEREYLEKYIPFTVNLTDMEFGDIAKELWDELDMVESGIEQKEILHIPTILPANPEVEKMLTPHVKVTCQFQGISIRTVRIYLEEAKIMIGQNEYFSRSEIRGTVLRFLFLKNFWHSYYEEFREWKDVEGTLLFEYKDRKYTMSAILNKIADGEFTEDNIKELFMIQQNQEVYFLLRMLDCEFIWKKKEDKADSRRNADLEIISDLKKQEKKNRINHVIWNILANGMSEYTDMEAAIDKFKKEVLSTGKDAWEDAWNKYCNDMYRGLTEKGNHTIFMIGDGYFIPLFQGFRIVGSASAEWQDLLEFYDNMHEDKILSLDLIKCLYYCGDVHMKSVYLNAMHLFCSCKIVEQFNDEEAYWEFLQVYLQQIFYFGYSMNSIFEPWNLEWSNLSEEEKKLIKEYMSEMIETMKAENECLPISPIKADCKQIIEFIQKNLQLMETNVKYVDKSRIRLEEGEPAWLHQETYDRLLKLRHDNMTEDERKAFVSEVEASYQADELYPIEIRALMENVEV